MRRVSLPNLYPDSDSLSTSNAGSVGSAVGGDATHRDEPPTRVSDEDKEVIFSKRLVGLKAKLLELMVQDGESSASSFLPLVGDALSRGRQATLPILDKAAMEASIGTQSGKQGASSVTSSQGVINTSAASRGQVASLKGKLDQLILQDTTISEGTQRKLQALEQAQILAQQRKEKAAQEEVEEMNRVIRAGKEKRRVANKECPFIEKKHAVIATADVEQAKRELDQLEKEMALGEAKKIKAQQKKERDREKKLRQMRLADEKAHREGALSASSRAPSTGRADTPDTITQTVPTLGILSPVREDSEGTPDLERGLSGSELHTARSMAIDPNGSFSIPIQDSGQPPAVQLGIPHVRSIPVSTAGSARSGGGGGSVVPLIISSQADRAGSAGHTSSTATSTILQPQQRQQTVIERQRLKHAHELDLARAQSQAIKVYEDQYVEMRQKLRAQVLRETFGEDTANVIERAKSPSSPAAKGALSKFEKVLSDDEDASSIGSRSPRGGERRGTKAGMPSSTGDQLPDIDEFEEFIDWSDNAFDVLAGPLGSFSDVEEGEGLIALLEERARVTKTKPRPLGTVSENPTYDISLHDLAFRTKHEV